MEKSAGVVVYRMEEKEPLFLLLKYPPRDGRNDYWGLPKGHIEKGEKPAEAARRELCEETGVKEKEIKINPDFKEWTKYIFKKDRQPVFKIVIYFLAETKKETVKISEEHVDYRWTTFKEAKKLIPFEDTVKIIEKAKKFI